MIPVACGVCLEAPAVVAYVNVFDVERASCAEHSVEVHAASVGDSDHPCTHVQCGRYATGVLVYGLTGRWSGWCDRHRGEARRANPEGEWLPRRALKRVIDLTGPVGVDGEVVVPQGAYSDALPKCWICGRRRGWEHDTTTGGVPAGDRHEFSPRGEGVTVGPMPDGFRDYVGACMAARAAGNPYPVAPWMPGGYIDPEAAAPAPRGPVRVEAPAALSIHDVYPNLPPELAAEYESRATAARDRAEARRILRRRR